MRRVHVGGGQGSPVYAGNAGEGGRAPSPAAASLLVSAGDFQLLDRVYSTRDTTVYRAVHRRTGRLYAVKERHTVELRGDKLHEVNLLLSLAAVPDVVSCHGYFLNPAGAVSMVLDWSDGGDLLGVIRRRSAMSAPPGTLAEARRSSMGAAIRAGAAALRHLPELQIWVWMASLFRALAALHARGLIHRDVKCANLLLFRDAAEEGSEGSAPADDDAATGGAGPLSPLFLHRERPPPTTDAELSRYRVKLSDLGVARQLRGPEDLARSQYFTPLYVAPEVLVAGQRGGYDEAIDVWSAGVVLYELCALAPPFNSPSLPGLSSAVQRGRFSPLPRLYSPAVHALVGRLLSVDPSLRPSAAEALAYCDDRIAALAPPPPPPPPPPQEGRSAARRYTGEEDDLMLSPDSGGPSTKAQARRLEGRRATDAEDDEEDTDGGYYTGASLEEEGSGTGRGHSRGSSRGAQAVTASVVYSRGSGARGAGQEAARSGATTRRRAGGGGSSRSLLTADEPTDDERGAMTADEDEARTSSSRGPSREGRGSGRGGSSARPRTLSPAPRSREEQRAAQKRVAAEAAALLAAQDAAFNRATEAQPKRAERSRRPASAESGSPRGSRVSGRRPADDAAADAAFEQALSRAPPAASLSARPSTSSGAVGGGVAVMRVKKKAGASTTGRGVEVPALTVPPPPPPPPPAEPPSRQHRRSPVTPPRRDSATAWRPPTPPHTPGRAAEALAPRPVASVSSPPPPVKPAVIVLSAAPAGGSGGASPPYARRPAPSTPTATSGVTGFKAVPYAPASPAGAAPAAATASSSSPPAASSASPRVKVFNSLAAVLGRSSNNEAAQQVGGGRRASPSPSPPPAGRQPLQRISAQPQQPAAVPPVPAPIPGPDPSAASRLHRLEVELKRKRTHARNLSRLLQGVIAGCEGDWEASVAAGRLVYAAGSSSAAGSVERGGSSPPRFKDDFTQLAEVVAELKLLEVKLQEAAAGASAVAY